jgi:hypothetical protein
MKKIGIIILALVIVMGSLGVGYAFWSQTLTIGGTAEMASMEATIVDNTAAVADPFGGPGTCTSSVNAEGDTLTVTISNAYPGYYAVVKFDVKNTGDISAYVTTGTLSVIAPSSGSASDISVNYQVPGNAIPPGYKLSWSSNLSEISINIPRDNAPVEGDTYTISLPLTVHQFNQPNP